MAWTAYVADWAWRVPLFGAQEAQAAGACMLFLPECFSFIGTSQPEVRGTLVVLHPTLLLNNCSPAALLVAAHSCCPLTDLPAVPCKGRAPRWTCYVKVQTASKVS